MSSTTRLEDIAERNTRSRIVDVAFAAMVALLLVLSVVSLRAVAAPKDAAAQPAAVTVDHVAHQEDGACETVPADC
jgi:hypothetical protein